MRLRPCPVGHHRSREKGKGNEMDRTAERITVEYSDGSSKEVKKGMCLEFRGDRGGTEEMAADMVGIARTDLIMAAAAFLEVVDRMGLTDAMLAYIKGCPIGQGRLRQ